jgi:hypothetical protein
VLFSVETTSTYYPLRNYWFAFIAATTSGILSKVLSNIAKGKREDLCGSNCVISTNHML